MGHLDYPIVDLGNTRLEHLSFNEQSALADKAQRAVDITEHHEEFSEGRALMDIKKLLTIIGGEYAERARRI